MSERKHVKTIYGDDGNVIFTQYRIDGVDYLENPEGVSIRLDTFMDRVNSLIMNGTCLLYPTQTLELVETETDEVIATVKMSDMAFAPDGTPMTEVKMLSNKFGVRILDSMDDEEEEEEEEKKPYDFKLVEHDDGEWLEWYDNDLIDHGFNVYDMARIVEDLWRKKQARENNNE